MRSSSIVAASFIAAAVAQPGPGGSRWFGVAPDDTVPGLVNLFEMDTTGRPIAAVASVTTADNEYPKVSTFHCSWTNDLCFFATGVGARYIQDYVYAVNRTSKAVQWKHTLPAGIYIDNLQFDYTSDQLFSIAFNPQGPNGVDARVVEYSSLTGNVTILSDISRELRGGFVFGGAFSICPTAKTMYVGVDARDGAFSDHVLVFDYALGTPIPIGDKALLFPIPSTLRAFCQGVTLDGIFGVTIQSDSQDRETLLLGDINTNGREGLFFPQVKGDLPTYTNRGDVPLFLSGLYAEHAGTVIVPVYAPFTPFTPIPFGGLWTVNFATRPPTQELNPIDYYLAGAAGIPA